MSPRRLASNPCLNALSRLLAASLLLTAALGASPLAAAEEEGSESVDPQEEVEAEDRAETKGESSASGAGAAPPPIGVRFGETLEDERLRIAYSWERTRGQGMMAGDNRVSTEYVRGTPPAGLGYTQNPRSLEVTVHTIHVAYAPDTRVTLTA